MIRHIIMARLCVQQSSGKTAKHQDNLVMFCIALHSDKVHKQKRFNLASAPKKCASTTPQSVASVPVCSWQAERERDTFHLCPQRGQFSKSSALFRFMGLTVHSQVSQALYPSRASFFPIIKVGHTKVVKARFII